MGVIDVRVERWNGARPAIGQSVLNRGAAAYTISGGVLDAGAIGIEKTKNNLTKVIGRDGRIGPARPAESGGVSAGGETGCGNVIASLR